MMPIDIKSISLSNILEGIEGTFSQYQNNTPLEQKTDKNHDWQFGKGNQAKITLNSAVNFHVLNENSDLVGDILITDNPDIAEGVFELSKPLHVINCRLRLKPMPVALRKT